MYKSLKYLMSENIELLFNIKEIQICWREECTTDARITTPPSQTSTRSLRPPVSFAPLDVPSVQPGLSHAPIADMMFIRWQTHDPILEEKGRLQPLWHPQTEITCPF